MRSLKSHETPKHRNTETPNVDVRVKIEANLIWQPPELWKKTK